MSRRSELAEALDRLSHRLDAACRAAGRSRDEVALLPVTKFFPAADVQILYDLGCREFGESREQEASAKVADTGHEDVRWHLIGRLQRNKSRAVARWAYAVHSVDSVRLAQTLARAVAEAHDEGERAAALQVFVQVSLDDDPSRGGVAAAGLAELADVVADAAQLNLKGLMAIPPLDVEPERAFARLAELRAALTAGHPGATELSAGMSNDLEIAVRHGSTCVRVGTALMGSRPIISD
ncbi:YggS family pyridoxal phosphate-dependent enzyme [Aldersonia sp. NBC_00410]|uniref:YggS family pyridoxal phosphate-dependent enzyme n=1 Tax=Aldersonia sp. NBC_00410 TaxID=2975954 RepID=UPI0022522CDF|nr:YggS family pyridoxal phosphate-dependent enzyme [Aldersonia sp. NBC_00410]MCX5045990.1 YggS family pyridoxal phosphate-dependent enzyme [Aldersonia sp. NBC_00410]